MIVPGHKLLVLHIPRAAQTGGTPVVVTSGSACDVVSQLVITYDKRSALTHRLRGIVRTGMLDA